jgi:hypothetical protein
MLLSAVKAVGNVFYQQKNNFEIKEAKATFATLVIRKPT